MNKIEWPDHAGTARCRIVAGLKGWLHHLRTDEVCRRWRWWVRSWGLSAAEQDEVWARWRRGQSLRLIARQLGKRVPSVRAFVLQTGGVRQHPPRRAQRSLSMAEREEISRGVAAGEPCRQIAARLGRAPSTVSRELDRNGGRGCYRAQVADAAAFRRAQRPKPAKLVTEPRLREVVEAKLAVRWSPQQIAGWLPLAYPQDPVMRVSHETIYLSLFVQSRGALRRELQRCLRTGRAMRSPRGKRLPQGRGQLRDTLPISQRPPEAAGLRQSRGLHQMSEHAYHWNLAPGLDRRGRVASATM